jgi:hypothetical protein
MNQWEAALAGHDAPWVEGMEVVPIVGTVSSPFELPTLIATLEAFGSHAKPGFMQPEGVVAFHTRSRQQYKLFTKFEDKSGRGK